MNIFLSTKSTSCPTISSYKFCMFLLMNVTIIEHLFIYFVCGCCLKLVDGFNHISIVHPCSSHLGWLKKLVRLGPKMSQQVLTNPFKNGHLAPGAWALMAAKRSRCSSLRTRPCSSQTVTRSKGRWGGLSLKELFEPILDFWLPKISLKRVVWTSRGNVAHFRQELGKVFADVQMTQVPTHRQRFLENDSRSWVMISWLKISSDGHHSFHISQWMMQSIISIRLSIWLSITAPGYSGPSRPTKAHLPRCGADVATSL